MPCTTPIIFIIFRRPTLTQLVFDEIRRAQPTKLLVIADGPRSSSEADICQKARKITEDIDWNCEVSRNYSDTNLGCQKRVSSGLNWAFEQVEEAIILEDDCLPEPSFFDFCSSLLEYYRFDQRVWVISGNNFQDGQWRGDGSYYFSRYNHCWGWATWKRAWKNFQTEIDSWPQLRDSGLLATVLPDPIELEYWSSIFNKLYVENQPDSWAYRWTYTCWINNALSVLPNINLVTNIGFGEGGTHTTNANSHLANLPTQKIQELVHPLFIIRDEMADQYTFDHAFGGISIKRSKKLASRIKRQIKRLSPFR